MRGLGRFFVLVVSVSTVFVPWDAPALGARSERAPTGYTLIGWNDLGMHCMDGDYSVLALLPPYNVVHAQLLDADGKLVTDAAGVTVSWEAIADADGSINRSSIGKTNFWEWVDELFGTALAEDVGLAGDAMPGAPNAAQTMHFDISQGWFTGEGIPITPIDDAGVENPYPLMRLVARAGNGSVLATSDVVLPVSDEMDCSACHASGSGDDARPAAGWVEDPAPERDFRLNVLRLHDQLESGKVVFLEALDDAGYSAAGLEATVVEELTPILCARCHASNALPGTGLPEVSALTAALHGRHAAVIDPTNGLALDATDNRTSCYRCHPGSETRCLRGAMGAAVADDATLAMQCQSCHGSMLRVGDPARVGWLEQPTCQGCHSGTATDNSGAIRFTSVFEDDGTPRIAANDRFATQPDRPAPGFDLYRFSFGHGGLSCEACHGSTHAVFPSAHENDNVQSADLQGHVGTLVECEACHATMPRTVDGGPHGLHPVGPSWIEDHKEPGEEALANCRSCHGSDDRGTVLSESHSSWTVDAGDYGTKTFWRGFRVGCYACHDGPFSEDRSSNRAAQVQDHVLNVVADQDGSVSLVATDPDGDSLELRIVDQGHHGSVGIAGTRAIYRPDPGFVGTDGFTYAAWDGKTDSNLGSVTVTVEAGSSPDLVFGDDFETGGTSAWSSMVR